VRRQVKPLKHKPSSQVPRSGSGPGPSGCMARHGHGSTVAQPATKGQSLRSNVASQHRSRKASDSHSSFSQQAELRLCSCAISALSFRTGG